jgi:hypothetical protein
MQTSNSIILKNKKPQQLNRMLRFSGCLMLFVYFEWANT